MFNKVKQWRKDRQFEGERILLFNCVRQAVKEIQPENCDLSAIPDKQLVLNGSLVLTNLIYDPSLADEAYGFGKDERKCPRLLAYLIGTIAQRGMLEFCGLQDDKELIDLVGYSFTAMVIPEFEDRSRDNRKLVEFSQRMIESYFSGLGHRDEAYKRGLVSFLIKRDSDAYRELIGIKHEILDYFDKSSL